MLMVDWVYTLSHWMIGWQFEHMWRVENGETMTIHLKFRRAQ